MSSDLVQLAAVSSSMGCRAEVEHTLRSERSGVRRIGQGERHFGGLVVLHGHGTLVEPEVPAVAPRAVLSRDWRRVACRTLLALAVARWRPDWLG